MKISVLTVCYNAQNTVRQTLDSYCEQTYQNRELILIDGASTDKTVEIAKSYSSIKIVSEPDQGMYDALNKGLKIYSGDSFGVLNADDTYHDKNTLAEIANALTTKPIVHGNLEFVKDHQSKEILRKWRAEHRPLRGFKSGWMPAHPTFYVRREVAAQVGYFDTAFGTAADYDWMLRAIDVFGYEAKLLDRVLIDMQVGGRSTKDMLSHIAHNLEALAARQKWLDAGLIDYALLAKPLRKISQFVIPRKRQAGTKNV
jgi:glycosyltransferase involved in cell wall biosynthesis